MENNKIYSQFEAFQMLYDNSNLVFESEDGNHKLDNSRICLTWQNGMPVRAVSFKGISHIEKWKLVSA